MKAWLKKFRIPKTFFGTVVLGVGFYLKNDTLISIGLSIIGLGTASKAIKLAQGSDPFAHEKHLLNLPVKEKE